MFRYFHLEERPAVVRAVGRARRQQTPSPSIDQLQTNPTQHHGIRSRWSRRRSWWRTRWARYDFSQITILEGGHGPAPSFPCVHVMNGCRPHRNSRKLTRRNYRVLPPQQADSAAVTVAVAAVVVVDLEAATVVVAVVDSEVVFRGVDVVELHEVVTVVEVRVTRGRLQVAVLCV